MKMVGTHPDREIERLIPGHGGLREFHFGARFEAVTTLGAVQGAGSTFLSPEDAPSVPQAKRKVVFVVASAAWEMAVTRSKTVNLLNIAVV